MRKLLCCLALVVGCSPGPEGSPGPQGEKGDPGPMGEVGRDGVTPKIPHLLVAATGEDLGVYVDRSMAWSEKLKAVVDYRRTSETVLFAEADCKGAMATQGALLHGVYFVAPARGTLVTAVGLPAKFQSASRIDAITPEACTRFDRPVEQFARALMDSGMPARTYRSEELAIELR